MNLKIMENFGKFVLGTMLVFLGIVLRGYVLTKFWAWFIVSTFEVKPLALINAIGICFFVGLLWPRPDSKEGKSFWVKTLELFVGMGIYLLIGWIVSLFF